MAKRTRRTLHQEWCDTGKKVSSHEVVWKDGSLWIESDNPFGEYSYQRVTDKVGGLFDYVFPDVDILAENFYEAFPEEVKAVKILYGKNST